MKKLALFLSCVAALALASYINSPWNPDQEQAPFQWQAVQAGEAGFDAERLNALVSAIKDSTFNHVDGLLVVRNNKLVVEEYFNGYTADSLHNIASVGKSITSALTGIAIDQGLIAGKEAKMVDFFTSTHDIELLDEQKASIDIEDMLTMQMGLACDDWDTLSPGNTMHFPEYKDQFAFTFNLPMLHEPGTHFSYCSGGANLLGEIIRRQSGRKLSDYASEHLFDKIGVEENEWFVVPDPPHYEFAGGGNHLTPRDMARFGLLYLNKGNWQGKQLIPADWVEASIADQATDPFGDKYGYFWWLKEFKQGDKTYTAFEGSGNGGNKITVIPELDMVIILTGSGYGIHEVEGEQAHTIMEDYIIAAVK